MNLRPVNFYVRYEDGKPVEAIATRKYRRTPATGPRVNGFAAVTLIPYQEALRVVGVNTGKNEQNLAAMYQDTPGLTS